MFEIKSMNEFNQELEVKEINLAYTLKLLTKCDNITVITESNKRISLEQYLSPIKVLIPLNQSVLQKLVSISEIKIRDIKKTIESLIEELYTFLKKKGYI